MADTGVQARRSAVYMLDQILGDEPRLMSELLAGGVLDKLPPDDRARAQRLAVETLRGMERADRLLQKHLNKQPPLTIRNVLRVGTVELCQGGAAHGVVNAMVNLVSSHNKLSHLKGLTNAVLRKIATDGPEAWAALRAPRLPKWLRGPLIEAWGPDAMAAMETAHFAGAPLDLTAKGDAKALAALVGGTLLETGTVRVENAGQVSTMPGFAEGEWWVQDAAAAIPVQVLAPQTGETVLDLCAAPGGKTMQLAAAGAEVTAVDSSVPRMVRVKENLARVGLTAKTLTKDARAVKGSFDAILLDAPCSATGTMRRHPDLPYAKDGSEFGDLIELQGELIDHAWTLLKPGGRLVFCTCSLLPDEGEVQVDEALERHEDMTVDRDALRRDGVSEDWITREGGLRLRPDFWADQGGMDGFYIACLRKAG
ncbi:RsmB/NOP family class I SAM-dependent RNA methyltransferase [Sulfitobacter mediterraneus]|uniref:RsmB/NOP family class I SAM-dependent RNA methyltransferase n=1 Tax=Sulfitobacter mediterraneus TaxID=83219 RepID=UPI001939446D|nr:RsmB/NOP family class I SAM-dependent RNA methyltransferase [Sulfitobacter mediterraneus]MBM1555066.1 RsmB/NOP family class I SAM-dependent RNA methyltransferase [Sulfitobacter mediterraneus]MBM1567381.1 RsmB/NOP family class I SAM-dependent RNA methyltransferase [Sulfitobacter mediterraneus]MBM1571183.1 RsmB/NOP family class I SAM-dependent RNA methyltransferase [Sulfitobacter mediterraneus]MBM1574983.1 RsmB/NOP family class I SAM-dependent RNA methyltransferase [Sulfitobacter mediterraneus